MTKYYVIHCKSLYKNTVTIQDFEKEKDAYDFANTLKSGGSIVFIATNGAKVKSESKDYKLRMYGAFPFYKHVYSYIAIVILLGLCVFYYFSHIDLLTFK